VEAENALFSLLCNHNKLGYLRSEPKHNVPLGWGSRGAYPPEAEHIFDLGIGTYNGSCKFWALIRHLSRGRAPVGIQGGPPDAENFAINLQQTFRDFFLQ